MDQYFILFHLLPIMFLQIFYMLMVLVFDWERVDPFIYSHADFSNTGCKLLKFHRIFILIEFRRLNILILCPQQKLANTFFTADQHLILAFHSLEIQFFFACCDFLVEDGRFLLAKSKRPLRIVSSSNILILNRTFTQHAKVAVKLVIVYRLNVIRFTMKTLHLS